MSTSTPYSVRMNHNRNVVMMFAQGPKHTQFLGINGCQLDVCELPNHEFTREYRLYPEKEGRPLLALDFANTWTKGDESIRMIPISPGACSVLRAILHGRTTEMPSDGFAVHNLFRLENHMAKKKEEVVVDEGGFRKPDGPVAQIHAYLDKSLDRIKAGNVTRGELLMELTETKKQFAMGTVATQLGRWAQTNGIKFKEITLSPATIKRQEKAKAEAATA